MPGRRVPFAGESAFKMMYPLVSELSAVREPSAEAIRDLPSIVSVF